MPAAVATSSVAGFNGSTKMVSNDASTSSWKQIAAAKQQSRLDQIPAEWRLPAELVAKADPTSRNDVRSIPASCGILTADEITITESPVAGILAKLHSRTWTSEAVTTAFCKRAAIAHQLTNCLTEMFFEEAIAAAKQYDQHYETTGKPAGPLAGLPISLKDNFNLKGQDSNLGFVAWINDPSDHDSTLVTLLRGQGAVLYCKTATPTAMMIAETVSNANGRTLNPLNTKTTPGGSSGGESALIAMRGSPLGVGTDIGGSIRIPCSFTGLWGLKPSFGRFPTGKCKSGLAGQEAVMSINGPMCNEPEGLEIYAKAVVDTEPWNADPKCVPISWTPVASISLPSSLTILVLTNNGIVKPTPPLQRALSHTAAKLRKAGHNVVEWDASQSAADTELFTRGLLYITSFFRAEGGAAVQSIMEASGEHADWVKGLSHTDASWNKTVKELWQLQAQRTAWATELLQRMREVAGGKKFDALVSPVAAEVTTGHDAFHHIFYTGCWNLMDMPAVVFPVPGMKVEKELDRKDEGFKGKELEEEDVWAQYNVENVEGMPISIQIVGHRLGEERTLAVAKKIHADCA